MAFQLSDDILDGTRSSSESGKTTGIDLREDILSLPVVVAATVDPEVYALVRGDLSSDAAFDTALAALQKSPALDVAREMTSGWAQQARASLADLPASPAREALSALCDLVVTRTA